MREASLAALELAELHPDRAEAAMAHRMHGLSCWFEGDFVSARRAQLGKQSAGSSFETSCLSPTAHL